MSRPTIFNPELRATLDRVGSHIENYQQNLDAVSRDIKAIEKYLDDHGVRQVLRVYLELGSGICISEPDHYHDGTYSGPIHSDSEHIEWVLVNDRWRLQYVHCRTHGDLDLFEEVAISGPDLSGPTEELTRRPLIETPLEVRLRGHKSLAALLEEAARVMAVVPLDKVDEEAF